MTRYTHNLIAHGKALAVALSMRIPFSDAVTHRTFFTSTTEEEAV